jgi:hypothetical protein
MTVGVTVDMPYRTSAAHNGRLAAPPLDASLSEPIGSCHQSLSTEAPGLALHTGFAAIADGRLR